MAFPCFSLNQDDKKMKICTAAIEVDNLIYALNDNNECAASISVLS
jgi:hypothetical protein